MKLLSSIFIMTQLVAIAHASQPRPDFIEAQMGFAKPTSSQNPTCRWKGDDQQLEVDFVLTWQNFEEPLHTGGFAMVEGGSSYLIFPMPNEGCTYHQGYGQIPPPVSSDQARVSLTFMGATCKDMIERLNVGTLVVHFYDVPPYLGSDDKTPVLRLQIWDSFLPVTCSEE